MFFLHLQSSLRLLCLSESFGYSEKNRSIFEEYLWPVYFETLSRLARDFETLRER